MNTFSLTFKVTKVIFLCLVLLFLWQGSEADAAFNQQINYQGKLTDNLGATVADGVYNIAFNLYSSDQTAIVWSSTTTVPVTNGLFSYMLGSSSTLNGVDFNQTLYLSVNVGGIGAPSWDGEMMPRKILGAVPAAFEADNAQTLDNIATSSFVRSDQADTIAANTASTLLIITQSGSGDILNLFDDTNEVFTVVDGGNVGIGTTSPYAKLSVAGQIVGQYFTATSTATSTFPTLSVTGSFYDSAGTAGANGYVLQTDGTSVSWVATSSLGITSGITGTEGYAITFDGSGNQVATSSLFFASDQNIGIGTNTPSGRLTIASPANVIGSELITNGTFTGSATGWSLGDCAAYGSNQVTVTYTSCSSPSLSTTFSSVSGSTYLVSFDVVSASGDLPFVYLNNSSIKENGPFTAGSHALAYTSTYTGSETLNIAALGWVADSSWTIDNVSVTEITAPTDALVLSGFDGTDWFTFGGSLLANTILGKGALRNNTTGYQNIAVGAHNLETNTTGYSNTAVGTGALVANTTGYYNTALGATSLLFNTTGTNNTALGFQTLFLNTIGINNTAVGESALFSNQNGTRNVALGNESLSQNISGSYGTALGWNALLNNTSATSTTAVGAEAGRGLSTYTNQGSAYLGYQSGYSAGTGSDYNTLVGYRAGYDVTTGTNNTILGQFVTTGSGITTGSNNILIGQGVRAGLTQTGSNQLNIGNLIFGTGLGSDATLGTGNVGIGSTTPYAKLSVTNTGTGPSFVVEDSASPDTTPFIVTAAGKVGIGVTSPTQILQVEGGSDDWSLNENNAHSFSISNTSNEYLYMGVDEDDDLSYIQSVGDSSLRALALNARGGNILVGTTTNTAKLTIQSSGVTDILNLYETSGQEVLTVLESGNLGIGTTSPFAKLSVAGGFALTGALYDSTASAGVDGYVLQTDGTSVSWVATSSLNIAGGSTVSFGTSGQIPFTNGGGNDFSYDTGFVFDGTNLSIGTSTSNYPVSIFQTAAEAQLRLAYDSTRYAHFQIDSAGSLLLNSSGDDIIIESDNLWICESGSCPSITASSTEGYAIVENGIYFGNGFKIDQVLGTTTELGMYDASGTIIMIWEQE